MFLVTDMPVRVKGLVNCRMNAIPQLLHQALPEPQQQVDKFPDVGLP